MQDVESVKELPPYFLGSIVLIKKEGSPEAEIVDGQQRLTTLTMLLAALRQLVPQEKKGFLTKFIYEVGNDFADTPDRYRLTLRDRDADFFKTYIQNEDGISVLRTLDPAPLSDSQKKIHANALLLLQNVEKLSEEQRTRLAQAMLLQCYLVEISTSDLDSAYNVFSILNDRGLSLTHADILKAQIIGKIPKSERSRYTVKWENIEEQLGEVAFLNLFEVLNIIYTSTSEPTHEPFLVRFRKNVYPTANPVLSSSQFIDKVLIPHAKALNAIIKANYQCSKGAEQINKLLKWLYLPYQNVPPRMYSWIAPVMHFLTLNWNNPDMIFRFLTDIERLEAFGRFGIKSMTDSKKHRERYYHLTNAIKRGNDLFGPESLLQLSEIEKQTFLEILNGDVYHLPGCLFMLLRLDDAISAADEAAYYFSATTIEHVLPQHPKANSVWVRWFPNATVRETYVNRLGNLVLLSRPKNSEAQNFDFAMKKKKYFFSERGSSSFALTSQVLGEQEWTPEVIERRQGVLLNELKKIWKLE